MLAPGSHPRFVTKYEVLKLLQERKEQRRLTNNKFATKQTRWLEGKIITNLTAMGTTKSETDESMQAWRAALPPSLSLKHQLQLLDLRPKNVVGAYVVLDGSELSVEDIEALVAKAKETAPPADDAAPAQ